MLDCTFKLNDKDMSELKTGALHWDAFSGQGDYRNKGKYACIKHAGPIPPGTYWIVDRPTGGRLGAFNDWWRGKDEWFALFADDKAVDDSTLCNKVERGQFRLHPKGPAGISEGCITLDKAADFSSLREMLVAQKPEPIKGSVLKAYGKVVVT